MNEAARDESWKQYSNALNRLLSRPELLARFQQDRKRPGAGAELKIPQDMQLDLKEILLMMPAAREKGDVGPSGSEANFDNQALTARGFYEATCKHLRRGAVTTVAMSALICVMGLVLLAIAAWEMLSDDSQGGTIALAATGIVAVAAAFYQSPVAQMRASAAEVQRSSMVLMSYMLGMSLVGRSLDGENTAPERETLITLTSALVELLPSGPTK